MFQVRPTTPILTHKHLLNRKGRGSREERKRGGGAGEGGRGEGEQGREEEGRGSSEGSG